MQASRFPSFQTKYQEISSTESVAGALGQGRFLVRNLNPKPQTITRASPCGQSDVLFWDVEKVS